MKASERERESEKVMNKLKELWQVYVLLSNSVSRESSERLESCDCNSMPPSPILHLNSQPPTTIYNVKFSSMNPEVLCIRRTQLPCLNELNVFGLAMYIHTYYGPELPVAQKYSIVLTGQVHCTTQNSFWVLASSFWAHTLVA